MKPSRSLAFASSLRNYAPKYPRPRPGTSERPAFHHPDPLLNNPKSTVTTLEDEKLTFIHRPPPTAPSPYSLTTAPASPLLRPRVKSSNNVPLPPLARPSTISAPGKQLAPEEVGRMRELRDSDPKKYTRSVLAEMFGVSVAAVGAIAGLKRGTWKKIVKERDQVHQLYRNRWTERHQVVKAIQKKRREFW